MFHPFAWQLVKLHPRSYGGLLLLTLLGTVATLGQAYAFARIIDSLVVQGESLPYGTMAVLGAMISMRMVCSHGEQWLRDHIASAVHEDLRNRVLHHMIAQGIRQSESAGSVTHILTDGLDHVDAYMSQYIPQALYAVLIPLMISIAIIDSVSWIGWILLMTYPLIPFFMILIGKQADKLNKQQWERMQFLGGHFLDVLQGLTTLKVFGRAKEQVHVIGRLSGEFRDATLKVLRIAFLSALVLELIGTISTAMIAVYLGVSLVYGEVEFLPAFFILLLAPDFYAPLRQLGAAFHTGLSGKVSLIAVQEYLTSSTEVVRTGQETLKRPIQTLEFRDVAYEYEEDHVGLETFTGVLKRGCSYMLVGESGAGKTTISNVLMQLLTPTKGQVTVDGYDLQTLDRHWYHEQIAYLSQTPYIMSGTLRENLQFGLEATNELLWKVLHQVQLADFVSALPLGLDTVIGEGGYGLSGGQRQRLALGRTLLRPAQILILDEVTAHLDVETENLIMQVLREYGQDKIVLYVGHRVQTMKYVDTLFVMQAGRLVESGSYTDLVAQNGYFASLVNTYSNPVMRKVMAKSDDSICVDQVLETTHNTNAESQDRKTQSDLANLYQLDVLHVKEDTRINAKTMAQEEIPGIYETEYDNVTPTRMKASTSKGEMQPSETTGCVRQQDIRRGLVSLWNLLSQHRVLLVGSVMLAMGTVLMNIGLLTTSTWLITKASEHPILVVLSLAIVGVRFFGIGRAICRYGERYVSHSMAFQGLYELRIAFFKRLEPLVPRLFQSIKMGDLLGRIMADIETLQFFYLRTLVPSLSFIGVTVLGCLMGYQLHPIVAIVIALYSIIVGVVLPIIITYALRQVPPMRLHTRGRMKEELIESIHGVVDIIMSHQETRFVESMKASFSAYDGWQSIWNRGVRWNQTILLGLAQSALLVGVVVGVWVIDETAYGPLWVAVIAIGLQAYFEVLQPMTEASLHGYESALAMNRLEGLEGQESQYIQSVDRVSNDSSRGLGEYVDNDSSHDVSPMIRIQSLSFAYDVLPIYDGLDLSIQKGEKVAIVGPSGSGKSTLFALLQGWYTYSGTISIDGVDAKMLSGEQLQSYMAYATQDIYVFHATIGDNIRLAKPSATDEEIWQALDAVQLADWVRSLPKGLRTMVGQGGMGLSGGQRQRLGMARLYLRDAEILLLDEPLEGLDQVTRHLVQDQLSTLFQGKTVLYITHHIEQLHEMDRILFLEQGHIVESGTYESLLALQGRFYEYHRLSMERI
ncbi:thiol reductant ABC exporter subunit CydD [Veillonella sp. CHU732]|uniref:thiol reductant ABC exporter subunit CydD n=1 Tax=Veillonella sp. CHU732 TaxID=2490949 RepID=UPI000F8EF946|nr:thiol reductant ABC exporter subunit CydD [Veillonella sp. CHU732]